MMSILTSYSVNQVIWDVINEMALRTGDVFKTLNWRPYYQIGTDIIQDIKVYDLK